ncbi:MAG: helix-turn-helix domain-containing protein [Candidatus Ornithomonoglobus sp.]
MKNRIKRIAEGYKSIFRMYMDNFKNSRLFRNIVFSYLLIGCAVFFIFAMLIVIIISFSTVDHLVDLSKKNLKEATSTGDYTISSIYSQYYKYYNDPTIKQAMYGKIKDDSGYYNLSKQLNEMQTVSSLVDSIYIINFEENIVYSSITSGMDIERFGDTEAVELARNAESGFRLIPRHKDFLLNGSVEYSDDIICMLFKENNGGAMMVNLYQQTFRDMVNRYYSDSNTSMVVTGEGLIVDDSRGGEVGADASDMDFVGRILSSDDYVGSFRMAGHPFMVVSYSKSDINGLAYIAVLSRFSMVFYNNNAINSILIGLIIFMLMNFIIAMIYGWSYYKPINNLQSVIAAFRGDETIESGELVYIKKVMKDTFNSVNKYYFVQKNELIRKILNGEKPAVIPDGYRDISLDFSQRCFFVILFQLDNYRDMLEHQAEELPLMRYGMVNVADELFEKECLCEAVEVNGDTIALLCCSDSYDESRLYPVIREMQRQMRNIYDISVTCSVSGWADSASAIPSLYNCASYAAKRRLMYGHGAVIFYHSDDEERKTDTHELDNIAKQIIPEFKKLNADKVRVLCGEFTRVLRQADYYSVLQSITQLVMQVNELTVSIIGTASDLNIGDIIYKSETAEEIVQSIASYCDSVAATAKSNDCGDENAERVKRIIEYIDNNYKNPELGIDSIAEMIYLTPNYVRIIFKEQTGRTVFDYISQKRFNEACHLLTDTKKAVKDICFEVGFSNPNYFYTAFKNYTGMTPSQFRKEKRK